VKRNRLVFALIGLLAVGQLGVARSDAQELSIYDVQYTTDPSGDSPYYTQIRDVAGGIVTHKWAGFNERVYLQDPAHATWGAIVVKDGEDGELYDAVEIGDWVSFDDIYVDEYRGTTFLQYRRTDAPEVSFTVESSGNTVPDPIILSVADLAAPIEDPQDYWLVIDRHSEPYESMIATLQNLTVGAMDLGKADDNYELIQGGDIAWGADYMNVDAGGPYHPSIYTGAELLSITGVVEQYYKITDTYGWDYYQLLTRSDADIVVPEPGVFSLLLAGLALARRRR